jgi:hypothetical protein
MAQLDRLIRDARRSMRVRGHTPAPAKRSIGRGAAIIKCDTCEKEVHVICKPQANEIQIAGEAVAINCNVATKNNLRDVLLTVPADNEISMEAVMGC